ncbi:hypothetical protein F895_02115 [Acinetobacter sp. CIP 64.2]|uniref:hypothetical protein n=1 Tax=Acinetobacter TaxID=469 RepID=UPI00028A2C5A|nr:MULTISPECIES: hypothetical protein [Acinetobacter]ENX15569.1 hypothetical protein F895_02115 [Acinetobacter sp. CIP 64.2]UUM26667.1 hypothetical protein NQU59_13350 [Acinetobacter colistiniresistens]
MTAFTIMKMSRQEENLLPKLAVEAFRNAFEEASESSTVVYAKGHQLLKQHSTGETEVIKDISGAYTVIYPSRTLLKRKKKKAVV